MKKHNYGYKVCYREQGKKRYIRYFLTYTIKQAKDMLNYYLRYPPKSRDNNKILNNPIWKIIPVSRKEILDGIWHELPFERRAILMTNDELRMTNCGLDILKNPIKVIANTVKQSRKYFPRLLRSSQ